MCDYERHSLDQAEDQSKDGHKDRDLKTEFGAEKLIQNAVRTRDQIEKLHARGRRQEGERVRGILQQQVKHVSSK